MNVRGNVIFAEGLNVQIECLMGVSKILFAERLKVQMCFLNVYCYPISVFRVIMAVYYELVILHDNFPIL